MEEISLVIFLAVAAFSLFLAFSKKASLWFFGILIKSKRSIIISLSVIATTPPLAIYAFISDLFSVEDGLQNGEKIITLIPGQWRVMTSLALIPFYILTIKYVREKILLISGKKIWRNLYILSGSLGLLGGIGGFLLEDRAEAHLSEHNYTRCEQGAAYMLNRGALHYAAPGVDCATTKNRQAPSDPQPTQEPK